jgi:hypothetical protein
MIDDHSARVRASDVLDPEVAMKARVHHDSHRTSVMLSEDALADNTLLIFTNSSSLHLTLPTANPRVLVRLRVILPCEVISTIQTGDILECWHCSLL